MYSIYKHVKSITMSFLKDSSEFFIHFDKPKVIHHLPGSESSHPGLAPVFPFLDSEIQELKEKLKISNHS